MEFSRLRPDIIKYEVRELAGTNVQAAQHKKRGGFGRFLSGMGRMLGAIAAPLSFIFPPAALGAAGAYGVSKIGDMVQLGAAKKMMRDQQSTEQPLGQVFIPGLTQTAMDLTRDTGVSAGSRDQQAMGILMARNDMTMASAQNV